MRRIFLSGVHGVGKSTIAKLLCNRLIEDGFKCRIYSNDNFRIYRKVDTLSSQIDRLYFGARKIREAEEESPEIAIFDRTLLDNIVYSRCFNRFSDESGKKYITDNDLLSIIKVYQMIEQRKTISDSVILFLNPPIDRMVDSIKTRGREKDTVLERPEFVKCLKRMFEEQYRFYIDSLLVELSDYDVDKVFDQLRAYDIVQKECE